jgi:hypothetical protein
MCRQIWFINILLVDEIWAVREYYTDSNGNPVPTFQDNVSVP